MQTYLYIHKEPTSGPQDRYRSKYPLKHVDYELSRVVGSKGYVLDISVDIRYGCQVSSMVDTLCFSPQAREYGYTPLSESVLYQILSKVNDAADNFGSSLIENSGKSRYKMRNNKISIYHENRLGTVFRGNQYGKTVPLNWR